MHTCLHVLSLISPSHLVQDPCLGTSVTRSGLDRTRNPLVGHRDSLPRRIEVVLS